MLWQFAVLAFFASCFVLLGSKGFEQVQVSEDVADSSAQFSLFGIFTDPSYNKTEIIALLSILVVALIGLLYAYMLSRQVHAADNGTVKMQKVAEAIRQGANSYLKIQARKIWPLIAIITVLLFISNTTTEPALRWGRSFAFIMGASFSWLVGYYGMRLATIGNLRVATAARKSYGQAMQLGYRTGTVTGMLTDSLGLLGGTIIFLFLEEWRMKHF
jgi:K(+)-stimulated pyrophosphate-energized sodium pump